MRAAIALPPGGRAAPARLAAAVVAALVVLLPLGRLPVVVGGAGPSRHVVVLDNVVVGTAEVVVRSSVRHLPVPLPVPHPAAAVLPALAVPLLLFTICLPMWVLSRRARRAHLLTSAGRGPPPLS